MNPREELATFKANSRFFLNVTNIGFLINRDDLFNAVLVDEPHLLIVVEFNHWKICLGVIRYKFILWHILNKHPSILRSE